jgi:hypothetical protein
MQGFANERGMRPLLDHDFRGTRGRASVGAARAIRPAATDRRKLRATKDALDGLGGLGWSVLGFVGGAVFWHFVGFWGFVSDVVLPEGPLAHVRQAGLHAPPPALRSHWLQVADASPAPCTRLSRDRRTGATRAEPCDGHPAALPADAFQGREDRMPAETAPAVRDD